MGVRGVVNWGKKLDELKPEEFSGYYVNKRCKPYDEKKKKEFENKLRESILREGEEVIFSAETAETLLAPPIILITNERVIKYNPGLIATGEIEALEYGEITGVAADIGLALGSLLVESRGGAKIIWKPVNKNIAKKAKQLIEYYKKKTIRKEAEKPVEDPLKILKIRFAKGEIAKEEYEKMKKILEQ